MCTSYFLLLHFPQRGVLYQGLHGGSSMVAMGKAGLLGHSLGAYGLPSPAASGEIRSPARTIRTNMK